MHKRLTNNPLHRRIWQLAWPLMLSNLTAPLLGLVDTAVVGHLNSPDYLAAVALGSNYFMFLYFSFNFLRMGTSGFTAQAKGAAASTLVVVLRALLLSMLLGIAIIAVNPWLRDVALQLLGGSGAIQTLATQYIDVRIWGAPAALANFALIGFAVGVHRTRVPLKMTVLMHASNAILSYSLVYIWQFDVKGVAAASAIADYIGLFAAVYWLRHELIGSVWKGLPRHWLKEVKPIVQLLAVNRDLFIRSLALLTVFFFFTAQSARLGDTVLAANSILLTFFLLLSSFLDGFANAAEALVGEAYGQASRHKLANAVKATGLWSAGVALVALLFFVLFGHDMIRLLTDLPAVRATAFEYWPWIILMPITASAGFWLDGVFVGATRAHDMRNTMLIATALFFPVWFVTQSWGNNGLWFAMNGLMATRGLLMGWVWLKRKRDKQLL